MPPTEAAIQNEIQLALGRDERVTMFRQNVGQSWAGKVERGLTGPAYLNPRDIVIRDARPLKAGLCNGSSDLVGWRVVEITPEMVGEKVAVFAAIEVKSARGRLTDQQRNFLERLEADGGLAIVARSPSDAVEGLRLLGGA